MINNLTDANIPIYVFGTLRKGDRLDFYMEGSKFERMCYTQGQLMKSELGSAYIDFKQKDAYTIGELYHVNFYCLLRINHLENVSGEFPTGYDIDLLPVWTYNPNSPITFDPDKKEMVLFYKRISEPVKIPSGDWINRTSPIKEIEKFMMSKKETEFKKGEFIDHIKEYLHYK